jgi:protein CpxP
MTKSTHPKIVAALICAISFTALHAQDSTAAASPTKGGRKLEAHQGARGGQHGARKGGERIEEILAQLNLTAEQQAQIKPLLEAAHTQVQAVRADTARTPEQKQAKLRETHQTLRSQIEGILTAEQKQKLQSLKQEQRSGRRGRAK